MPTTYGQHTRFTAQPAQGDALAAMLLAAADGLRVNADCLLYLVSRSPEDPDVIWVTEAWTSKQAHADSLKDERVLAAIQQARPLIAGVDPTALRVEGGKGL